MYLMGCATSKEVQDLIDEALRAKNVDVVKTYDPTEVLIKKYEAHCQECGKVIDWDITEEEYEDDSELHLCNKCQNLVEELIELEVETSEEEEEESEAEETEEEEEEEEEEESEAEEEVVVNPPPPTLMDMLYQWLGFE